MSKPSALTCMQKLVNALICVLSVALNQDFLTKIYFLFWVNFTY